MSQKIEIIPTLFKGARAWLVFVDDQLLRDEQGLVRRFFSEAAAKQAVGIPVMLGPWGKEIEPGRARLQDFMKPRVLH